MRHNGLVRGQVDRGAELLIALLRHARAFWLFQRWFTFRKSGSGLEKLLDGR
ncbi:MAG TPA: hypothetical protein VGO16_12305 [Pseudonocardiaceae bacterium]|nr:hypothetical protein [Pseudonocardiaceae bacterium]